MTYHDHRCLLVVMSIELANDHTVVIVLRQWKEFLSTYLYKIGVFIPPLYIFCSMAGPEAGQTLKAMLIDMHSQWTPWGTYPSIGSLSLLMIYSHICREAIWLVRWSTTSCTTLICLGFQFRFGLFWYYHEYPSSCRTSIIQTWCFAVSQDSTEQSMLLVTSISPPGVSCIAENGSGHVVWFLVVCLFVCLLMDRIYYG